MSVEEQLSVLMEDYSKLQAKNERLKEAILNIPISKYGEAQRDGCDPSGAWDCFIKALHEWKDEALKGQADDN